jgi:hypothetical protein
LPRSCYPLAGIAPAAAAEPLPYGAPLAGAAPH